MLMLDIDGLKIRDLFQDAPVQETQSCANQEAKYSYFPHTVAPDYDIWHTRTGAIYRRIMIVRSWKMADDLVWLLNNTWLGDLYTKD